MAVAIRGMAVTSHPYARVETPYVKWPYGPSRPTRPCCWWARPAATLSYKHGIRHGVSLNGVKAHRRAVDSRFRHVLGGVHRARGRAGCSWVVGVHDLRMGSAHHPGLAGGSSMAVVVGVRRGRRVVEGPCSTRCRPVRRRVDRPAGSSRLPGCLSSSLTSWKETPSSGRAAEAGAGEAVAEGGGISNRHSSDGGTPR